MLLRKRDRSPTWRRRPQIVRTWSSGVPRGPAIHFPIAFAAPEPFRMFGFYWMYLGMEVVVQREDSDAWTRAGVMRGGGGGCSLIRVSLGVFLLGPLAALFATGTSIDLRQLGNFSYFQIPLA